jgi:hypothetical protein
MIQDHFGFNGHSWGGAVRSKGAPYGLMGLQGKSSVSALLSASP